MSAYPELNNERPDWQRAAACRTSDLELFFSENRADQMEAKKICADCPVATECLEHAIVNNEQRGVWGGMSLTKRRATKQAWLRQGRLERTAGGGPVPVTLRLVK